METIERERNIHPNAVKFHDDGFLGDWFLFQYFLDEFQIFVFICISGDYNGQTIFYKLTANERVHKTEIEGFTALNALNNPEVEK